MFNEKRYVWNYLFNGLFEWHSERNKPDLFAKLSQKKAPKQKIREYLADKFIAYLISGIGRNSYNSLLYLFCVESVGIDKDNPLGLFQYFQPWVLSENMFYITGPKYYLKDKEQPGFNLGSWSYLNNNITPLDMRNYVLKYRGHRDTADLDCLLAQLKKDYPLLPAKSGISLVSMLCDCSVLRKEAQKHPEKLLDILNPDKLQEEWFSFQEYKKYL